MKFSCKHCGQHYEIEKTEYNNFKVFNCVNCKNVIKLENFLKTKLDTVSLIKLQDYISYNPITTNLSITIPTIENGTINYVSNNNETYSIVGKRYIGKYKEDGYGNIDPGQHYIPSDYKRRFNNVVYCFNNNYNNYEDNTLYNCWYIGSAFLGGISILTTICVAFHFHSFMIGFIGVVSGILLILIGQTVAYFINRGLK